MRIFTTILILVIILAAGAYWYMNKKTAGESGPVSDADPGPTTIYFTYGSENFVQSTEAIKRLHKIANDANSAGVSHILVVGHSNPFGSQTMSISVHRASTVKDYLEKELKVTRNIVMDVKGDAELVVPDDFKAPENDRVEVWLN